MKNATESAGPPRFQIISVAVAAPLAAQLPAGYTEGPAVLLPDTLHAVHDGGTFRIRIARAATNAFERALIERTARCRMPSRRCSSSGR